MITSYSVGSPPVLSCTRPLSSWRVLETSCLTGMLSTTPETDSSSIGESARTDDVWNVKLTCRKDTERLLGLSATGCPAAEGDPSTRPRCQRGAWQDRLLVEPGLSMRTLVSHCKQAMHR